MHCDIYKSGTKDEMYAYIARPNYPEDEHALPAPENVLPEAIQKVFGKPTLVMHLDLAKTAKLARVNILHVLDSLQNNGFFIQMPPEGFINTRSEPEGLRGA